MGTDEGAGTAPEDRSGAVVNRFETRRRIRFSDCDPAGIVFYPRYFEMFDGLVEDWVDQGLGLRHAELVSQRRVGLPTVHLEVDFVAASRLGEWVTLGLQVERIGHRSLALQVDCAGAERGDRRITMRQVLVVTCLDTHRSVDYPADLLTAIHAFAAGADSH